MLFFTYLMLHFVLVITSSSISSQDKCWSLLSPLGFFLFLAVLYSFWINDLGNAEYKVELSNLRITELNLRAGGNELVLQVEGHTCNDFVF